MQAGAVSRVGVESSASRAQDTVSAESSAFLPSTCGEPSPPARQPVDKRPGREHRGKSGSSSGRAPLVTPFIRVLNEFSRRCVIFIASTSILCCARADVLQPLSALAALMLIFRSALSALRCCLRFAASSSPRVAGLRDSVKVQTHAGYLSSSSATGSDASLTKLRFFRTVPAGQDDSGTLAAKDPGKGAEAGQHSFASRSV